MPPPSPQSFAFPRYRRNGKRPVEALRMLAAPDIPEIAIL
jgi:hypothetical protein